MGGGKHKAEKEAARGGDGQGAPQASRQVYEAVQDQYHIHDNANEHIEKKARSCMLASALVATLLVIAATAREAGDSALDAIVPYLVIAAVTVLLFTITLCMLVNKTSPHPVPTVGKRLWYRDRLDEKEYTDLVKNEEDFYKLSIAEYAEALAMLKDTNKEKSAMLKNAYISFAVSIILALIGLVPAIAS